MIELELLVAGLIEFIKALGVTRLAAMGAVAIGLIGFFAYIMLQISKTDMSVLYTDLAFEDSAAIIKKLDALNIPYKIRQNGSIILAPKDKVFKLRMEFAEDNLPSGGYLGNKLFDKGNDLGTTNEIININKVRALEGELARTIRSINKIQMVRVHLNLPKKKLFSRRQAVPSASIVVKTRGTLDSGQIKAIRHIVASAIDGLKPTKVSIMDEKGKLLASAQDGDDNAIITGAAEERNRNYEIAMKRKIEDNLINIVGNGKVDVRVTAELDYNKITKNEKIFDPDGQVVRSTKTFSEASSSSQPSGDNSVTVGNELPSAGANNGGSKTQKENLQKSEEVVNYEISQTSKTEIIEAGRVKRISVAVLVDGKYAKDADGKVTYAPRPQAELDEISQLVRTTIGFDAGRGDKIHVANLRFVEPDILPLDQGEEAWLSKDDYFYIAELIVTLLIALLVLLFVIRPLVRRIITPEEIIELLPQETIDEQKAAIAESQGELVTGPDGQPLIGEDGEPIKVEPKSDAVDLLNTVKLAGEIQASFVNQVGELVLNNPREAVNIIRNWIEMTSEEDEAA